MKIFEEYSDIEQKILSNVYTQGVHLWIGEKPILESEVLNLLKCTNYRAFANNHNRYSVIWYIEKYLSDLKEWKVILDELLRLLTNNGILILRYNKSAEFFSNIALKNFLGRRYGCDAVLLEEHENTESGLTTSVFRISKYETKIYEEKTWTFATITNGKKIQNVVKFCESVRKQANGSNHEIIIVGPRAQEYDEYKVKYLDVIVDESKGEICKKKNAIINSARGCNIAIVHDRYYLNSNFVESFDVYGYNFDYLTVPQFYTNGEHFPSLNGFESHNLYWSRVTYTENFNRYPSNAYINGGFIVLKKQTALKIFFNELLFWNQAEDVELSKHYLNQSLVPRVNSLTAAYTIGIDSTYTSTITNIEEISKESVISSNKLLGNASGKDIFKALILNILKKIKINNILFCKIKPSANFSSYMQSTSLEQANVRKTLKSIFYKIIK